MNNYRNKIKREKNHDHAVAFLQIVENTTLTKVNEIDVFFGNVWINRIT